MSRKVYLVVILQAFLVGCASPAAPAPTVVSTQPAVPTEAPTATALPPTATLEPAALQQAMFAAAKADDTPAMEDYIAAGANINVEDDLGVTVLEIAAARNNVAMVELLLDSGAPAADQAFVFAVTYSNDDVAIVQTFIDHGANIDAITSTFPNHTVLMYAAEHGYIEVGKLLLASGADINKPDAYNDPALNVASFNGQLTFARMLVEAGAELNVRGYGNRTALGHAIARGHTDVVTYLESIGGTQ